MAPAAALTSTKTRREKEKEREGERERERERGRERASESEREREREREGEMTSERERGRGWRGGVGASLRLSGYAQMEGADGTQPQCMLGISPITTVTRVNPKTAWPGPYTNPTTQILHTHTQPNPNPKPVWLHNPHTGPNQSKHTALMLRRLRTRPCGGDGDQGFYSCLSQL